MSARELDARIRNLQRVLAEFMTDVEVAGIAGVERDWPDLACTYQKARELLHGERCEMPTCMRDAEWEGWDCRGSVWVRRRVCTVHKSLLGRTDDPNNK